MNGTSTLSISELRKNAASIIDSVSKTQQPKIIVQRSIILGCCVLETQQPKIIVQRSKPKAVLVDVNYFYALEEMLLDLTDSREAEKARMEEKSPFSEYLKRRWGKTNI